MAAALAACMALVGFTFGERIIQLVSGGQVTIGQGYGTITMSDGYDQQGNPTVIALEERLSEIRYQLESLESQLRLYDNQVDYSTVNLDIQEIVQDSDFTPTEPEGFGARVQKGLSKNLASLAEGAVSFAVAVITLSPFWLPLLVIALSLLFVIRRAAKQKKDSRPKEKPEEKS